MIDLNQLTVAVRAIAKEAGAFIKKERETFTKEHIELKGKSNLVSYVDKETEKLLVSKLKELIPAAGFITEENTIAQNQKEYTWIIDPLDGTTNFIHGLPTYSVSIGLTQSSEIVLGVVYEVNLDECFYAHRGGGAFLNGQKISVSDASQISESLFATGFPIYNFEQIDQYMAILNDLMKDAHGLRRVGSAAVDLAYVACGRYEGYFEYNLNSWDVAAGILLVKEAGGTVSDFSGGDNALFGKELVAGGDVFPALLNTIRKFWNH
ncbi:MAG: myo-inositol-1(or 4)-monophosphatase [Marinoscillum sp.]|jgi:myo-inositol-1(or 4)-monophosphatase